MPKTNRRFVAMIMGVIILLIAGILLIVYITTNSQTKKETKEMLQVFANAYDINGFPKGIDGPLGAPPATPGMSHLYEVSTFYAVSFDSDGNVKEYFNDNPTTFSDSDLVEYAKSLLDQGDTYYRGENVTALITYGDDYTLVTMMDTAVTDSTITHLVINMLVYGAVAIVLVFILSFGLAKWVMRPAEKGYERQKQFISDAGHELKTPISAIGANIAVLKKDIGDNRWLDNISYENDRMFSLVCQMLDLARIESQKTEMTEVNFSSLCEAEVLPFEAAAYEQNVDFTYMIESEIVVMGNENFLKKLVGVLIENGISHCKIPGKVRVELKKKNSKTIFFVSNTGDFIPESERAHMFERFYKSDESRAEDKGHYGLGLSIAKAIVDEMGAKIHIECKDGLVSFIVEI